MRILLLASLMLAAAALPGCLEGSIGLCSGNETPQKIITDDRCKRWIIEVDHVAGYAPESSALSLLESTMDSLVRKDDIVIADGGDRNIQGRSSWTDTQLRNLHRDTQDHFTGGDTVVTHLLYVNGQYSKGSVVGVAFGSEFVVIFQETIQDATEPLLVKTTAEQMENSVLVHEFGHILGLVNGGTPMHTDHEADTCDTGNGPQPDSHHSDNPSSVMFCAVERTSSLDFFGDAAPPTKFDSDDKKDIACAGGKGSC